MEFERHLSRVSSSVFLGFLLLLAGIFILIVPVNVAPLAPSLRVVFFHLPLLFAPFAAHLAVRDRASGFSEILAVMPGTYVAACIKRVLVALTLLSSYLLISSGALFIVMPQLHAVFPLTAAGFAIGSCSIFAGFTFGMLARNSAPAALWLGFIWVAASEITTTWLPEIAAAVPDRRGQLFSSMAHVLPLVWASDIHDAHFGLRASAGSVGLAFGLVIVVATWASLTLTCALAQDHQGRLEGLRSNPLRIGGVGVLTFVLISAALMATPTYFVTPMEARGNFEATYTSGHVQIDPSEMELQRGTRINLIVYLNEWPDGAEVAVIEVRSPHLTFKADEPRIKIPPGGVIDIPGEVSPLVPANFGRASIVLDVVLGIGEEQVAVRPHVNVLTPPPHVMPSLALIGAALILIGASTWYHEFRRNAL